MVRGCAIRSVPLAAAVLAAVLAGPAPARADLTALVPAYFYPVNGGTDAYWGELATAAQKIPVTAIFDPGNGPGTSYNSDYGTALQDLENAPHGNGQAVGYVYTDYGSRPLADVEADLKAYMSLYGSLVQGFFIDQVSNDPSLVSSYYNPLYEYIKETLGASYRVITNPGTNPSSAYLTTPTADTIVSFEDQASHYTGNTTVAGYPADRFANIIHSQPTEAGMLADLQLAAQNHVGYVYVTDQMLDGSPVIPVPPAPQSNGAYLYDRLPSYWDQEVADIQSLNAVPEPSSAAIVAVCGLLAAAGFALRRRGR